MKIRTAEQLSDELASEISWRRKELTDIRYLLQTTAGHRTRQAALTRAAVGLLYAHWEGFIKAVSEDYLEFVCMQRCKNAELADAMLAIVLRSRFHVLAASRKIQPFMAMVEFFREELEHRSRLPYKNAIRTEANVSSVVLIEVLRTLGLSSAEYEAKCHIIDHQLLAKRNHIAHGSALDVSLEDYLRLHDEVLSLMNTFRNHVENAAAGSQFLKGGLVGAGAQGEQPMDVGG